MEHNASVQFHCNRGISDLQYCPNGTVDECLLNELIQDHPDNATNLLFTCDVSDYSIDKMKECLWICVFLVHMPSAREMDAECHL